MTNKCLQHVVRLPRHGVGALLLYGQSPGWWKLQASAKKRATACRGSLISVLPSDFFLGGPADSRAQCGLAGAEAFRRNDYKIVGVEHFNGLINLVKTEDHNRAFCLALHKGIHVFHVDAVR